MAKGTDISRRSVLKGSQGNNVININQVGIPVGHMISVNISNSVVELDFQMPDSDNMKLVGLEIETRDNDVIFSPISTDLTINNSAHMSASNCMYIKGSNIVNLTCALNKLYATRATASSALIDITATYDVEDESQADYNNEV